MRSDETACFKNRMVISVLLILLLQSPTMCAMGSLFYTLEWSPKLLTGDLAAIEMTVMHVDRVTFLCIGVLTSFSGLL